MATTPEPRCVLVGVDGSPNSIAALRRAVTEAAQRHALLDVVHVTPTVPELAQVELAAARSRLDAIVASVIGAETRFPVRQRVVSGEPGTVLPALAAHGELLVIGARVHSEHGDPFGGDTVPYVLRHSPCEVVICADQAATAVN